jgi:rod shape-determining protein MreD
MHHIIAAALAVAAALVEFTVVPYLKVGDATLDATLVIGVIWTIAVGLEAGLTYAFIGGIALDILGQRPLGSSAFALLVAIGIASLIGGALSRLRVIAPVVATAVAAPVYQLLLLFSTTVLSAAPFTSAALATVVPSTIYDTIVAALFGPLVMAIMLRRQAQERMDW